MQVGSLVVCVDDSNQKRHHTFTNVVKGRCYTVRMICIRSDGSTGILLDEITNPTNILTGNEIGFKSWRFRELDTPKSICIEEILNETVPA